MLNIQKLAIAAIAVSTIALGAQNAYAESELRLQKFTESGYEALVNQQKDGIVVVTKDGCPVCTKQVNALENILEKPEFENLTVQQISVFDPRAKEDFGATRQSLIIIYNDGQEVKRLQSVTNEAKIESALRSYL